jgi:serine/threonine protein kinase
MTEIHRNNNLKITKNVANNIFRIELKRSNPALLCSLTKFIKGSTCSDDYLLLTFKAYSVEMLNKNRLEKPSISMAANMAATLGGQLCDLLSYSVTFIGFNAENIMVVNGNIFLFLDIGLMREVEDEKMTIFTPFTSSDFFFSPELKFANKLPLVLHYKTSYFSLGCLLLYVLLCYDDAFYQEYLLLGFDSEFIGNIFKKYLKNHPIKETKLYWLIERCLVEEPEKRVILFI